MISPRLFAASVLLAASRVAPAAVALDPQLPPYEPGAAVSGEITIAGNHATDDVMVAWAKRFARFPHGVGWFRDADAGGCCRTRGVVEGAAGGPR